MHVDLDSEAAEFIQRRVDNGRYSDAVAVIHQALKLLAEQEKRTYLRAALAKADAQIDRGEYVEWTPDLLDRLAEEAREMKRLGIKPHPDVLP